MTKFIDSHQNLARLVCLSESFLNAIVFSFFSILSFAFSLVFDLFLIEMISNSLNSTSSKLYDFFDIKIFISHLFNDIIDFSDFILTI